MNLLCMPTIRAILRDGPTLLTLPGVFAAMMRDDVLAFPGLRAHQRHAWHAFLTQLGTLVRLQAGAGTPADEDGWRDGLRRLTPEYSDDAPWCLVSSPDAPALLQPAVPDGIAIWRGRVATPDALDILITARNHDVKQAVMAQAQPDDWLFALVTLQTMEGYGGKNNYGITRMNGGSASRPCVCLVPSGGPGAHWRRDVGVLVALDGRLPYSAGYAGADGLALTWLTPWDGKTSISRSVLHPLYIEVCRRVRLIETGTDLAAFTENSTMQRIAETPGGVTGDPWAPIRTEKEGIKVLTMSASSFGYREVTRMLLDDPQNQSALQPPCEDDDPAGLMLLVRGLVRGNSKTDGYHERRVPLSRAVRRMFGAPLLTDADADAARARVALVGEMCAALRYAFLVLLTNGKGGPARPTPATTAKSDPFVRRFEQGVDRTFFPDLWDELEKSDDPARTLVRRTWAQAMLEQAELSLAEADRAAPKSSALRLRARVRAQAALHGTARRDKGKLGPLLARAAVVETPHVV